MIAEAYFAPSSPLVLPPDKPPVAEWSERHLRFDPAVDAATSYIIAKSPYAHAVFDWWLDPEVEEIFMLFPTQSGKTTTMNAIMAYCIANDPGPMIFVQADEVPTKAFIRMRLKPTLQQTFPGMIGDGRSADWTDDAGARIGGTHLWPAWSTSESRCRSWPRRYVFGDETSIWQCSRQMVWERTKQFQRNRKALWGTTPTEETEQSWIAANEVFRLHRWHLPCPLCGAFQALEFKRLKFDHCKSEAGAWDLDQVEAETGYQCEHCEQVIPQSQRPAMLQRGEARTDFPDRSRRRMSLRITALDVPNISWGLTARQWLESQANPDDLRVFVNSWLVEPWRPTTNGLAADSIMKRTMKLETDAAPEKTVCILAAVDVQRGHVWVTVRAFLEDERSVLIHCQRVEGRKPDGAATTAYALDQVWDKVLSRHWKLGTGMQSMGVMRSIVDSGDGETAGDVYRFAEKHRGRVVLAKGSNTQATPWRASAVEKMPDGKAIIGGLPLYTIKTEFYREIVIGAFTSSVEEQGAWMISTGIPREYSDQMTSWQVVEVRRGKDNRAVRQWKQIRRDDHYLDAECYTAALWEILRHVPKGKSPVKFGVIGRVG